MSRKKKPAPQPLEPLVPRFPFGKFKGRTVEEVMRVESSYLGWFEEEIQGCEELKEAIRAHPRFPAVRESYLESRRRRQEVEWQKGRFSTPTIDGLCEELFHGPEAEDTTKLKIVKGIHYGDYVQSGENLSCEKAGDELYRFQVCEKGREYEPWIVTPATDLSEVPLDILEQMDHQMSYCGECEATRDAKFSETRKHVQRTISRRSPS